MMIRRYIISIVLLGIGVFLLLNCGSNPVSSVEDVAVTQPSSSTVWSIYDTDLPIAWSGHNSDNVVITLYKGDTQVTTIAGSASNCGSYTWSGPVPDTITPGANYRVKIEDGIGTIGWSANFEIADVSGSDIVTVTKPNSGTEWQHFHTGYSVDWSYPTAHSSSGSSVSINTTTRTDPTFGSPQPLSGDSVRIELWQDADKITDIVSLSSNPGSYSLTELVPMSWGTGSNYKIKIVDNLGNYGFSEEFSITPTTGSDVISVTEPNSSTSWEHNEINTEVVWTYPANSNGGSSSVLNQTTRSSNAHNTSIYITPAPLSGDSVRVEIWQGGSKVGDYSSWIDNTGSYTRSDGVPGSWGDGDGFQLKVIDSYDNFGWSAEFNIVPELISVTQPNGSTNWNHYEMGAEVLWDYPSGGAGATQIKIELMRDGAYYAEFSGGFVGNNSPFVLNSPIPASWGSSSDYEFTLRLEDSWGNYGISEEFQILNAEIFNVTSPSSSTTWTHYESGQTISWDNPSDLQSDSVAIHLYKGDDWVAELVAFTDNNGTVMLDAPFAESYVPGTDYTVQLIDEYGDFGISAEFTIEESNGAEIISVNTPTSSTEWEHFEVNTVVEWSYPALLNLSLLQPISYDEVTIDLYKNGTFTGSFSGGTVANNFSYTRADGIPAIWTPGNDYQIRVEDDLGNFGWSEDFTINAADAFTFNNPVSSTTWMHYASDVAIEWDYASSDSVQIVLTKSQVPVDTLSNGMIDNTGSFTLPEVSDDLTPGTDYQIYIIDNYEDYGWSEEFTVALSSGAEVINVTDPGTGTVWEHFLTGYPINWEYGQSKQDKAENQSEQVSGQRIITGINLFDHIIPNNPLSGDEVLITLLKYSVVVDTIGGDWMPNTNTYTLTEGVSYYWGVGTDYQIKITDDLGNHGTGESFQIFGTGGAEIIAISDPSSSTTWAHYEINTEVSWIYPSLDSPLYEDSVMLQVWSNGGNTFVGNYSDGWVENTGTFTRADGIPAEWSIGTDYQIKAVDDLGNFGWSESFAIENGEAITITAPNSETTWMHYQLNTLILWDSTGIAGDEVIIQLFRGSNYISTLASGTDNDGLWVNTGQIPDTWTPAANYKIKITDTYGDWGWSEEFTVSASTGQNIYEVTTPTTGTTWAHFETNLPINWGMSDGAVSAVGENATRGLTGSSTRTATSNRASLIGNMFAGLNPSPLSGDSVTIELHKGGSLLVTLTALTDNDNSWTYTGPVPMEWVPGSDYQIKIIDNLTNWGISDQFTINPSINQEVITVTAPTSSTTWEHYETNTQVIWNYPAIDAPISGDEVSLQLYSGSTYVGDYSGGYKTNTGSYTRTTGINAAWGTGSNYRIKVLDNLGNFGWSDSFGIENAEVIPVSEPGSSTNWMQYSSNHSIVWDNTGIAGANVTIDIYKNESFIETLSSGTSNDGSWTYTGPVPGSWTAGTDYQIKITDTYGDWGWSDEFEVSESSGQQIYEVTTPSSTTTWTHFDTDLPIDWSMLDGAVANVTGNTTRDLIVNSTTTIGNTSLFERMFAGLNLSPLSGDSVTIELHKGSSLLVTLTASTDNNSSWTYTGPVPMEWEPGSDYQIKIIDNLTNWGISDQFTINPSSNQEVITVTAPTASTTWEHYETNTQVIWNYPDAPLSGDEVSIQLYLGSIYVGDYSGGYITNSYSYTRTTGINAAWGTGSNYRIKVLDNLGNFGWSDYFIMSSAEVIPVSEPSGSTSWMQYTGNHSIVWDNTGIAGANVTIDIYKNESFIETLSSGTSNDGSWTYTGPVPGSWTAGTDYQIKITDTYGDYGWSNQFEVTPASGQNIYEITTPSSTTIWTHFDTNLPINWNAQSDEGGANALLASLTGNTSRVLAGSRTRTTSGDTSIFDKMFASLDPSPLSGDSVTIELHKGGSLFVTLTASTYNDNSWTYSGPVPMLWTPDSDYQIKIIDNLTNWGISDQFTINPSNNQEVITVTAPTASTTWEHYETNTLVIWNYPAIDAPLSGDEVSIQLYSDSTYVGDYSGGYIANSYSYTRTTGINAAWGTGSNYRIKVLDNLGNFGWSDSFTMNNAEVIPVSEPSGSTSWMQYSGSHSIVWDNTGIAGANVTIDVYKNDSFIETLSSGTSNDGSWSYAGPVPGSWTAGTDYQIKITDTYSDYGWSDDFAVTSSSAQNIYEITTPSSTTTWTQFETDLPINWNIQSDAGEVNALLASLTGNTSRVLAGSRTRTTSGDTSIFDKMFASLDPSPLSGDSVTIELHKGGSLLVTLTASTYNDSSWTLTGPVPMAWLPGSDYQIKIIDNLSNWGISDQFTVAGASGQEIIEMTDPTSSTTWRTLEPGTQVTWEYPTDFNSDISTAIPFAGRVMQRLIRANSPLFTGSISIEIWKDGSYLGDYSDGLVPNTNTYTRTEAIPSSWGTGSNYQIKMIDTNSNYGYSDQFSILNNEIDVLLPSLTTIWEPGDSGIQSTWNGGTSIVKLELWSNGELIEGDFSPWITNTGNYTYPETVPSSWDIGEHFQIHIINSGSTQHGWSEEFQIFNEIDISHPNSQTIWACSRDSLLVEWDDQFGDSLYVDIYKGGTYLDSFLSWTTNDGNEVRLPAIPSSWGTGEDFQLRIENNKGSFGWSDMFRIWAIEVIKPDSNTIWNLNMTNTEVEWGDVPGSHVRIVVCHDGDSIGTFTPQGQWIDASMGTYTREEEIPEEWCYNKSEIEIIDNEGNTGLSEVFSINIFSDGFENGLSDSLWSILESGSSIQSTNPHSGNSCLRFRAWDSNHSITTLPEFSISKGSCGFWVRDLSVRYFDVYDAYLRFILYNENDDVIGYAFQREHYADNKLSWLWRGESWSSAPSTSVSLESIPAGEWAKVDIIYQRGSTSSVSLLVNGEVILERSYSGDLGSIGSFSFKGNTGYPAASATCYIDDISIYSVF